MMTTLFFRRRVALQWGVLLLSGWLLTACQRDEPCPLCDAIVSGDEARVRQAIPGAEINKGFRAPVPGRMRFPFNDALERLHSPGSAEGPEAAAARSIVMLLLESGADPNGQFTFPSEDTAPPYIVSAAARAAESGDARVMRAFVARGLNPKHEFAGNALIAASGSGYADVVQVLLEAGVDVNYRDRAKRSALSEAIRTKNQALIAVLEQAGAKEF